MDNGEGRYLLGVCEASVPKSNKTKAGKCKVPKYRCSHCNELATVYCKTCTDRGNRADRGHLVAVCSLNSKRGAKCINEHFASDTVHSVHDNTARKKLI